MTRCGEILPFGLLFSSLAEFFAVYLLFAKTLGDFWQLFNYYEPMSYLVIWLNFVKTLAKFGPHHPVSLKEIARD